MAANDGAAQAAEAEALSVSERLAKLAVDAPGESVTIGWILDQFNERAFGLFLLVLALPCCVPFLYGVPQLVSLPMLFIAGQMSLGRRAPWLPERLRRRTIKTASLADLSRRAGPYLAWFERLSRPRLTAFTRAPLDQGIGALLAICCLSILTPLPGTNTVPGIGVAIASLGLLQRDGGLTLLGTAIGLIWVAFLILAAGGLAAWLVG